MDINMQNNAYYNVRQKSAKNQMISPNHYTKQNNNNFKVNDSKSPLRDRTRSNIEDTTKKTEDNTVFDKSGANTPTYAQSKKDLSKEPYKSPNSNIKSILAKRESSPFENLLRKSTNIDYKSIDNASTNDRSRSSYKTKIDDDKTPTPKSDFDKSGKSDISSHDFNKQESSNTPRHEYVPHKKNLIYNENNEIASNIRKS